MRADCIPEELRELPQWVVWRLEERDGKPTKVPCRADAGGHASVTDPTTWTSYDAAVAAAEAEGVDGIGFVFTEDDPFAGVDFDHCVEGEDINPHVANLMRQLDSYSELSPSGTGLHTIVRAKLNGGRRRTSKTPWHAEFEHYDRERFFCMTGRHLRDTPRTVNERQRQLAQVRAVIFPPAAKSQPVAAAYTTDDHELLELARAARNGAKFDALYGGHHSHGSASEADLALCNLLAFWCGPDAARIDSLFRRSGLMRPKWDELRGETTYGAQTIERALEGRTDFYAVPAGPAARSSTSNQGAPADGTAQQTPAVHFTPSDELLREAPLEPEWMWEHGAAKGAVSLFAGKPKVGKSTLTYELVGATANRESEFLGRVLHGGPVVYASEEGSPPSAAHFLGILKFTWRPAKARGRSQPGAISSPPPRRRPTKSMPCSPSSTRSASGTTSAPTLRRTRAACSLS